MKIQYDIIIAGLPIGGFNRTTPETLQAFKTARVLFDLTSNARLFRRFCKQVVNLDKEYWTGELDEVVYERITTMVLDAARTGAGVVLVVDGHPAIYQDLSLDLLRRGKRRGLNVRILPALSCIDLMIASGELPLDAHGLQILEATSIVGLNTRINPFLDLLIMQIGWFGTSLLYEVLQNTKGRFKPLITYLTQFYPGRHRVKLLRVSTPATSRSRSLVFPICSLDKFHKSITTDTTLFIPALDDDYSFNEKFRKQTENKNYLASIARLR